MWLFLFLFNTSVLAEIRKDDVVCELTIENGLAGESVTSVITDHLGQVWIATSNGINRYNGRKLLTYRLPKTDNESSYVFDICEDDTHSIYASTKKGVFRLSPGEITFEKVTADDVNSECVTRGKGCIYFGSKDGLNIFDGKHVKTIAMGHGVNYSVRNIALDGNGLVWFLTKYELNSYDPQTGRTHSIPVTSKMTSGAALAHLVVEGQILYLGTKNNGLWTYSKITGKVTQVSGVGHVISYLERTEDRHVCVGCDGAGAFLLEGSTGKIVEQFSTQGDVRHWIPTDAVYCYFRDKNGVNWLGLFRQGLHYTYHSSPKFQIYKFGNFNTEGMYIRSFLSKGKELLIGSRDGLWYVDHARNIVKNFSTKDLGGAHIITQMAYYEGLYYIATFDGGLKILNPSTLSISKFGRDPLLDITSVSALAVSPENRLWIGSSEGLYILDSKGGLQRYTENNSKIYGGGVNDIFFDKNHNGWLLGSQGMSIYSDRTKLLSNVDFPKGFFNKESFRKGVNGHDSTIFFLAHNGIFYTDAKMSRFGELSLPDGLLVENSYGFIDDRFGHYWIATESGLFCTDYKASSMLQFGYGEGLVGLLINAISQDANGKIWLGTSNGLLYIDPRNANLWQKENRYKVLLYDIYKGENLLDGSKESAINDKLAIKIGWNFGSEQLSMKVILDDFARPYGRLYEYKIDDDGPWKLVKDGAVIFINSLQLGEHDLHIRKVGMVGSEKIYSLTVIPTTWAIIEIILLIISIILLIMWRKYRNNTNALLDERKEIEQALIEVEQEKQRSEEESELLEADDAKKYDRIHLDENECKEITDKLRIYVEEHKPYLNCDYKMSELAETLHISPSKLSLIFNTYIKENYYEFINFYRLKEFKRLIEDGEYKRYTLTALSEKCGFKRSTFFSTFRKVEGMTPTEYLKKQNINL